MSIQVGGLVCSTIIFYYNLFSNLLELRLILNSKKRVSCHLLLVQAAWGKGMYDSCVPLVNSDRELFLPLTS